MKSIFDVAREKNPQEMHVLIDSKIDINQRNEFNMTPLMIAASWGRSENVGLLLSAGADIHARHPKEGTALIFAAKHGTFECVDLLLKAGAETNARGWENTTALIWAACRADERMIAALLSAGGDPYMASDYCGSALKQAQAQPNRWEAFQNAQKILFEKELEVLHRGLKRPITIQKPFKIKTNKNR